MEPMNKDVSIGSKHRLTCGLLVTVVAEVEGAPSQVVVEDEFGRSKGVSTGSLKPGLISWHWDDEGNPVKGSIPPLYRVGDSCNLKCGALVTVIDCPNYYDVVVEDSKGNTKEMTAHALRQGTASRKIQPTIFPKGCYVYMVVHNNNIVYIGKGRGSRIDHVTSGRSHNKELNRLHFAGEEVSTVYYKTELSELDATVIEADLIREVQPMYNSMLKNNTW